ncbi:relaxin-3-like [Pelobates cultripes]|uniref:Relaxin-3-like n=1 Tax=Pelobates cultripes TaxID=61616 RepID=A0AAD1S7Z7_PELCU|nr:relaxin-3-like [Pelobates cultripes]
MEHRAVLCAALLLLVAHLPRELRAQRGQSGGSEYGVKLCGREFIRAVIFTCGGSRWKRLSVGDEQNPGYRSRAAEVKETGRIWHQRMPQFLVQPWKRGNPLVRNTLCISDRIMQDFNNKELNELKLHSLLGSHVQQLQKTEFPFRQQPPKDSFDIVDDYKDYFPLSDDFSNYVQQVEESTRKAPSGGKLNVALESDGLPWMKFPSRRRRESSVGVAGICCKWGCTKAEISTLC